MKLGTQTASLMNHLTAQAVIGQPEPEPGMGATLLGWTDRYAATIERVFTVGGSVHVEVRRDTAELVAGSTQSEAQEYTFKANPKGAAYLFRRSPEGIWRQVRLNVDSGRYVLVQGGGKGLRIGERDEYSDPTF